MTGSSPAAAVYGGAGVDGEVTPMLPQGGARSIPRGSGDIPPHGAQLQTGETKFEGTTFAAQEPVLSYLCSLSPPGPCWGRLANFLIHHSSSSPPDSPWILPHRLQFPYFTLYFLVLGKSAPQFLCWLSFSGRDLSVCPPHWSPCPTLPPVSLSSLCIFSVCFPFGFQ